MACHEWGAYLSVKGQISGGVVPREGARRGGVSLLGDWVRGLLPKVKRLSTSFSGGFTLEVFLLALPLSRASSQALAVLW